MATKSENADIAVLQEQMKGMTEDMGDVKSDVKKILDRLDNSYVKKEEFRAFKWTTIPITIIVSVVLTFLVTFFLQNITKDNAANNPTSSSTTTTTTPTGSTSQTRTSDTTNNTTTTTTPATGNNGSTSGGVHVELPKL